MSLFYDKGSMRRKRKKNSEREAFNELAKVPGAIDVLGTHNVGEQEISREEIAHLCGITSNMNQMPLSCAIGVASSVDVSMEGLHDGDVDGVDSMCRSRQMDDYFDEAWDNFCPPVCHDSVCYDSGVLGSECGVVDAAILDADVLPQLDRCPGVGNSSCGDEVERFLRDAFNNQMNGHDISQEEVAGDSRCVSNVGNQPLSLENGVRRCIMKKPTSIFPANQRIVLPDVPACYYCKARRFYLEPPGFCCCSGDIVLKPVVLPPDLVELLTGSTTVCKHFRTYIRLYNGNFTYTSMGVKHDKALASKASSGIYTFKVSGQIHHYLGGLQPSTVPRPGLELYFYDPQNELQNRMATCSDLNKDVMVKLMRALDQNPYAAFLRSLNRVVDLDRYYISINCSSALDQRTHNSPTAADVAVIWLEGDEANDRSRFQRDIRVYAKSGDSFIVREQYSCYDALAYPLMFPRGEPGWHPNILKANGRKKIGATVRDVEAAELSSVNVVDLSDENNEDDCISEDNGRTVSPKQYYCYKLQMRPDDESFQLSFGRLLQQFVVDMYIKIESMRLLYIRSNQAKFRVDFYQGLVDSIAIGVEKGKKVGRRILLPASFIGGPRDMRRRYADAMALVRRFGKPDIFLTMTCNSRWPEITKIAKTYEEIENRPDLVVRIFRAKVEIMKKRITVDCVFGKVASLVYVIEYQKRGLPHAHFLVILKPECKLRNVDAYDRVVCAELPSKAEDPELHEIVGSHMFHGPCGELNSACICMKDGKCSKKYPKSFCEYTVHGEQTYPQYRRRINSARDSVRVGKHVLDNRWIVPYNPRLIREFDCHMNVEVCCDIRAVKYLYKYVYKGVDKVSMKIVNQSDDMVVDEVSNFQSARWICPQEAVWRIYGFHLSGMSPSVYLLQVHLPDFQSVRFCDDDELEDVVNNSRATRTMLTEFFNMNSSNEVAIAKQLYYMHFPEHFVWNASKKIWTVRKKGEVIGRLASVNPSEGERYFLRLLLLNVKAPKSFDDLLMVNGSLCSSLRESANLRGLLISDDTFDLAMEEGALCELPRSLRFLFAMILSYCELSDPVKLYRTHFDSMCEDLRRNANIGHQSDRDVERQLLLELDSMLETVGKTVNDFGLGCIHVERDPLERMTREIRAEFSIPIPTGDLFAADSLNSEEKKIYDDILEDVLNCNAAVYFVDGPGGTGKTYLYRALLAKVRSMGHIAIATASSGIASTLLPGGRTAHSRFGIPIEITAEMSTKITKDSSAGMLLTKARLIIWDEAPMVHKKAVETVDAMLKDFCETDVNFGGKVIVFGGDFRQTLPVVQRGSREEIIQASMVTLDQWPSFKICKLTENMRAKFDPEFCDFLLRVGDGVEPHDSLGRIQIPDSMLIPYINESQSLQELIKEVYPDLTLFISNPLLMCSRAILTPKNEAVDEINEILINRFPGEKKIYRSVDRVVNSNDESHYADFLSTLTPTGMPKHELVLKLNCPVVLLRNLNPLIGFANGTRLICTSLDDHVVGVKIVSGQFAGTHGFIPKINLLPREGERYVIPFSQQQFPLRLAFVMTVNKSQGQTLDSVGIFLRQPVFGHGQLYVALSHVRTSSNVKILIGPPTENEAASNWTRNEVYQEVLQLVAAHLGH